jgi:glycosyltransferase involved in cell wall biosynthesis
MKKVAILAALNLEKSIGEIVKRTKEYVDEVIVVSDGSIDNTNLAAQKMGARSPKHTSKRGKGFAVRKGIEFSKQFDPNYIILMDADGQHLPEEIPTLLNQLYQWDIDMVVGSRMKGMLMTSNINKLGNVLLKILSLFMTGRWFSDTESGFRALRSEKLYSLTLNSIYYEIETELLFKFLKKKYKVIEVPITVPKAIPGVTIMDGVRIGLYKLKTGLLLKLGR